MVTNRGSRTQMKSIRAEIYQALETATKCHEEYMQLLDEEDPNFSDDWIEELKLSVSLAAIEVQEYLDSRADEPPSEISSLHCSNWLSTGSISGSIDLYRETFSVTSVSTFDRYWYRLWTWFGHQMILCLSTQI